MQMTVILAFAIIVVLQGLGDIISAKTNGKIPSIFISCILFLIGFWTFIPTQIETASGALISLTEMSGISGALFNLLLALLVTNMGTLMSIKELLQQWKTIVIGVVGIGGALIFGLVVGNLFFSSEYGIVIIPSLVGGLAAVNIMREAALEMGFDQLATIAILVFSLQGIVGYPLMNFVLRRQAKSVLKDFKEGKVTLLSVEAKDAAAKPSPLKFIPDLPAKLQTPPVLIGKLALVAWLAETVSGWTDGTVHTLVLALVFGIIATEIGFLEKQLLVKTQTMGLLMILLMGFVFGGLATATPQQISDVFLPLVTLFTVGTIGLVLFGIVIGKFFGESWAMSTAIVLNCLCGFPPNYVLTVEASKSMSSNEDEYNILMQEMLPKVLVGGFATVTVLSVIIANLFVGFL